MAEEPSGAAKQEPIRDELNALKADIAQLRDDLRALTDAVKGVAAERVSSGRQRAEEQARKAWEDVERRFEEALNRGRAAAGNVEQEVTQHPALSLFTAFGAGFLIAKLLETRGPR